ncbi:S8 family serine peptidase [Sphingobium sp. 15-1]|uniref:S8 family peptidase n=1 Tax=Sphingobium sp. 15-1 TaxID=2729616 RepID=UPI00159C96EE|nr:S8 family serine peptidase [Sphingobium sp. 15-1]
MIRTFFLSLALMMACALPGTARGAEAAGGDRILVMLRLPPTHFRASGGYGGGYGDSMGRSQAMRQARRIARDHHLTLVTDWMMPVIDLDCFVMRLPAGIAPEKMAEEVSQDPAVAWSQPMHDYRTLSAQAGHDDPLYPAQPATTLWHLDSLHRLATGRGVTVAVIDSGIDARHPDLAGQIKGNLNFVAGRPLIPERHGTAVAGIIAARADNRAGIVGIAPAARLLGLRACWQSDAGTAAATCDSLSLAKALHYAIDRRAAIINLSLGGPPDRLLATLLDAGMMRGATVVAAYDPHLPDGGFPASHSGVFAVSGGPIPARRPVYIAPARDIPAPRPGGGWTLVEGTSYAAAHVSGLIALLEEAQGHRQGRPRLVLAGGGYIDALATVRGKAVGCDGPCPAPLAAASRD